MNKSKLSIKQWLEEEISKAGKPIKFEKTKAYVHDNLIIAKFNETRMTIQTYNFTDYLSDEQSQEKQYDLKNMLPAGSSYSGIIAEFLIEYNNIKLKVKYYFLFPGHLKVGLGDSFLNKRVNSAFLLLLISAK